MYRVTPACSPRPRTYCAWPPACSTAGTAHGPLRASTVATFLTPGRDPAQALGLRVWSLASGPAYGHTGFPGVAFALLPEHDAAVVMITNRLHAAGPPRSTEDMWLRALAAADLELNARPAH